MPHAKRLTCFPFLALLPAFLFVLPVHASTVGQAAAKGDAGKAEPDKEKADDINFPKLAKSFRDHCVRVYIHAKSDHGNSPAVGDYADDIKHERPTPVGGYWWDDTRVIIPDELLHDRFIRSIEVSLPNSGDFYPARVAGRFTKLQAVLLEVMKNADGELPESSPLSFGEGSLEDAYAFNYSWSEGEWRIAAKAGVSGSTLSDSDVQIVKFAAPGVLIDEKGNTLGLGFGKEVVIESDPAKPNYWLGAGLKDSPFVSAADSEKARAKLEERLVNAVLEARFRIRMNIDEEDEDEAMQWADEMDDSQLRDGSAEIRSAAFVVGKRHLLCPVPLPPEGIARIDSVAVVLPGGREVPGRFAGAFREYMAVLVEVEETLPTRDLPSGFGRLNPLVSEANGSASEMPVPDVRRLGTFQRWLVDYSLGRRREQADYDRWLGTFRGYRGDVVVSTMTNEENGSLAFDDDGRLVAVSLTPRLITSRERGARTLVKASPGFRPLDFLSLRFKSDDVFDPSLVPVEEEEGGRIVDLGVEYQSLDANTARLFNASHATRGGKIGVMITHVYPGSIAEKIGLKEKDVLLRLYVEGRTEPMELRSAGLGLGSGLLDIDMTSDMTRSLMRYMPPPWPSRENIISTLLTAAGADREAVVEYSRDGEQKRAKFTTSFFKPNYRSAPKTRFRGLGLTVKPITFEVARYFSRPDDSGVIISRVEVGGKSSVAGLHQYLLITQVDGRKVEGVDDFRAKLEPFEHGDKSSIELTVEGFGKTRLVKIE